MKRTLTAALALVLLLTGCGAKQKNDPALATEPVSETLTVVTEAATAPPRPIAERAASLQAAGDTYIYDELGVLTDEEKKQYNDYLGWLCSSRQVKAAAVLTGQLGGASPEDFAKRYFETLYGAHETGFLVLINNDTNRDCIYRAGSCAALLSGTDTAIAKATPCLVEERYADALEILLPAGESLSDRIFDRCGALTAEQVQTLDALAKTAENKVCVLLTDALPGETPPETTEAPSGTDAPETEARPAPEGETEPLATPTESEPTEAPSETAPAVDTDALHSYAEDARKAAEADVLLVIHTPDKTAWIAGGDDASLARVQAALASGGAYEAALAMFAE